MRLIIEYTAAGGGGAAATNDMALPLARLGPAGVSAAAATAAGVALVKSRALRLELLPLQLLLLLLLLLLPPPMPPPALPFRIVCSARLSRRNKRVVMRAGQISGRQAGT